MSLSDYWRPFKENCRDYGILSTLAALPLVFLLMILMAGSGECPICGVELVGGRSGRCPNCDHAFDREARIEKRLENIESQYASLGESDE